MQQRSMPQFQKAYEIVKAGGYGEHRFDAVTIDGKTTEVSGPVLAVLLEPGAGARLQFRMTRNALRPTFSFPWHRAWYPGVESRP